MSIKNIPASLLDAVKNVVQEDRTKFFEEQQQHDKLVAEKMLSPKQKKIAAVAGHPEKIDAEDFAALRAGKKVAKEDVELDEEELDEGEGQTRVAKAKHGINVFQKQMSKASKSGELKSTELVKNLKKSVLSGKEGLTAGKLEKLKKEEVEELDEISKSTLASYIPKAARDSRISGQLATGFEKKSASAKTKSNKDAWASLATRYKTKAWNREDNIAKAANKLAKEDVELDERAVTPGTGTSPDPLQARVGLSRSLNKSGESDRAKQQLKTAIKSTVANKEHGKSNLPEEYEQLDEVMPSGVIKQKQRLSMMNSKDLHKHFTDLYNDKKKASDFLKKHPEIPPSRYHKEYSSVEDVARDMAWSHGYGRGSGHYWNQIKHHEQSAKNEEYELDEAGEYDDLQRSHGRAVANSLAKSLANKGREPKRGIVDKLTGGRVKVNTDTDPKTGNKFTNVTLAKNKNWTSDRPVGKSVQVGNRRIGLRVQEETDLEEDTFTSLDLVRAIMEARGRPRKNPEDAKWQKQAAKPKAHDDEDEGDDYEGRAGSPHHATEPDKHISVQLRVASDMKDEKGGADVKFADGKSHFVKHDVATNVLNGLEKVKPMQRGEIHDHIAQSHENLMNVHKMLGGK